MDYADFIASKTNEGALHGFDPVWMPDKLFPFQVALAEWSIRKGRAAVFADCGLGKTFIQLTWAENVARKTCGRVLILTPLAVAFQTVKEGEKIGVEVTHRREGLDPNDRIVVTNYERLHYFDPDDFAGDPPRQIMHEYGQEMRFDEKPPVRGLHKNLPAHPPDFRRETLLVGKGAEMLDDAVAVGDVVAAVGIRQLAGVAHRQREAR